MSSQGAQQAPAFSPVQVGELELSRPLEELVPGSSGRGSAYASARLLVRVHGAPLGWLDVDLSRGAVPPQDLAALVSARLGDELRAHLTADGLDPAQDLAATGPPGGCPRRKELPARPPLVTVVVCTVAGPQRALAACLDSLAALDYPSFEVLVVDNSPELPETVELISQRYAGISHLRYVREPLRGLSRARNTGMRFARGDVVAFTDDDATVDPGWLRALVVELDDPDVVCVTGLAATAELETAEQQWFDRHGGFEKGYRRRVFDLQENRADSPLYPYAAGLFGSGVNMAFRKGALGDLWEFDLTLGAGTDAHGGEDMDAFLDVLMAGRRIVYTPDALVWHRHRTGPQELRTQMRRYGVGLTAVMAKRLLTDRGHRLDLVRRIPAGVRFALADGARQNPLGGSGVSRDLARTELAGLVVGPLAYLRGRARQAWLTA